MQLVAYRNTERAVQAALARKRETEAQARREAEERARIARDIAARKAAEFERQRQALLAERWNEIRMTTPRYRHSYERIERTACRVFRVTKAELRSERRSKHVSFARQFVMYWAARLTIHSLPAIGKRLGGRDHTTILSGKRAYPAKRAKMGRHLRPVR